METVRFHDVSENHAVRKTLEYRFAEGGALSPSKYYRNPKPRAGGWSVQIRSGPTGRSEACVADDLEAHNWPEPLKKALDTLDCGLPIGKTRTVDIQKALLEKHFEPNSAVVVASSAKRVKIAMSGPSGAGTSIKMNSKDVDIERADLPELARCAKSLGANVLYFNAASDCRGSEGVPAPNMRRIPLSAITEAEWGTPKKLQPLVLRSVLLERSERCSEEVYEALGLPSPPVPASVDLTSSASVNTNHGTTNGPAPQQQPRPGPSTPPEPHAGGAAGSSTQTPVQPRRSSGTKEDPIVLPDDGPSGSSSPRTPLSADRQRSAAARVDASAQPGRGSNVSGREVNRPAAAAGRARQSSGDGESRETAVALSSSSDEEQPGLARPSAPPSASRGPASSSSSRSEVQRQVGRAPAASESPAAPPAPAPRAPAPAPTAPAPAPPAAGSNAMARLAALVALLAVLAFFLRA